MLIPYHDDNPTRRFPYVTVAIIVVNLVSFVGFYVHLRQDEHQARIAAVRWGFVPRMLTNLPGGQPVAVDLYPEFKQGQAPQQQRTITLKPTVAAVAVTLVTSMFMHGSWWHLLGNMLFFWIYGNNIEDRIGHVLFALFYLLGGVAATLCQWLMARPPFDAVPMVGASGAVAVIMGAYIVTYPKAKIRVLFLLGCIPLFFEVPALFVLGFWIVEQLLQAYWQQQGFITNVALWAHIGGFLIGALIMPFLAAGTPEPTEDWDQEATEQFDYEHIDPNKRRTAPQAFDNRGIWWDDVPRRELPGRGEISWEDES